VVRERCLTPGAEPWALVHGLLVAGAEAEVGGEPAVERLVRDGATLDAQGLPGFPKQHKGRLVEPHPGTFAKVLLELGVDLDRRLPTQLDRPLTLRHLAEAEGRRARPGQGELPFHNEAWQLEVLAHLADDDATWAERLPALRQEALATLSANQAYFAEHLGADAKPYTKPYTKVDGRPAPAEIHRYFCGGLHFFQAVQRLHGAEVPPVLADQYAILRARIHLEGDYWEAKTEQVAERYEGAQLLQHLQLIGSQQLKLQGHALETLYRALAAGALQRDAALDADLEEGWQRLSRTVLGLEARGVFGRLDAVRDQAPQLYLDLVGDSAHALHAYVLRDALK
jgi:hypothetical protein